MSACDTFRHDLGPYVLGGLEPDEAEALEGHLTGCAACRAEHAQLADTPRLLARAQDAPPRVPDRVRDRLIAAAARRRARQRGIWTAVAAAVVAAVVGGLVGWQLAASPDPVTEVAVPLEDSAPFEASGHVSFTPDVDTVRIHLLLEGLEPLPTPGVYEAWLYTAEGRIISIGQLTEIDGSVEADLVTSGSMSDFRTFWVTAEPDGRDPAHEGPTVVRAAVPELR